MGLDHEDIAFRVHGWIEGEAGPLEKRLGRDAVGPQEDHTVRNGGSEGRMGRRRIRLSCALVDCLFKVCCRELVGGVSSGHGDCDLCGQGCERAEVGLAGRGKKVDLGLGDGKVRACKQQEEGCVRGAARERMQRRMGLVRHAEGPTVQRD